MHRLGSLCREWPFLNVVVLLSYRDVLTQELGYVAENIWGQGFYSHIIFCSPLYGIGIACLSEMVTFQDIVSI